MNYKIQELEKKLKTQKTLYLIDLYDEKEYKKKRNVKTSNFVKLLISKLFPTHTTYEEGINDKVQCKWNKNRSLTDIYLTTRHYYKRAKLEEIMKTLVYMTINDNKKGVLWCPNIKKRVFTNFNGAVNSFYPVFYKNTNKFELYGKYLKDGCDELGLNGDDYMNLTKIENNDIK